MLRHHGVFKPSNRKAASQHQVTQQRRFLPFWGVIIILVLTTLACSLSRIGSGSHSNSVVILTRLPTLTPTPRAASISGQAAVATDTSVASELLPPTATATPSIDVPTSGQVVATTDTSIASPPLPPTTTASPLPIDVPVNVTEAAEPTSIPPDTPTVTPQPEAPDDWLFVNVQLYPGQSEEGLLVLGEMTNNSSTSQTVTEVTGIFYDAQGQVIADANNTFGYWPVDIVSPGGRIPFELIVEGIQSAANFNLSVEAEPSSITPRQDFEFLDLDQWNEADTYCLAGQFRNPGAELQNYLVIGATLYDEQDNIVNFGDYYEPDLEAMGGGQPLEFEICIVPPNQGTTRYELWAWGE